jgi:polysaccharide pyruvyl transferase WcaK-like protein
MTHISRLESRPKILARTATGPVGLLPARRRPSAMTGEPRKHPRRMFGLFGSGNDGSLEAMLTFVREVRPDAEVTCICSALPGSSKRIAQGLHVAAVALGIPRPDNGLLRTLDQLLLTLPRRVASLFRAIGCVRKLDTLIISGTGILDDFGEGPSGVPLTLLVWCLTARSCGTRIAFVSIGAGPRSTTRSAGG